MDTCISINKYFCVALIGKQKTILNCFFVKNDSINYAEKERQKTLFDNIYIFTVSDSENYPNLDIDVM